MIKIYTLSLSLLSFICLHSQIPKKANLLGGDFFYGRSDIVQSPQEQDMQILILGASYGRAIRENTVLGMHFTVSPIHRYSYVSGPNITKIETTSFSVSPYFRKYKTLGRGFYFFGEAATHFGMLTSERKSIPGGYDWEEKNWNTGLTVAPGIAYQLLRRLHLQITIPDVLRIQYGETKYSSDNPAISNDKSSSFEISSRLRSLAQLGNLSFGLYFIL